MGQYYKPLSLDNKEYLISFDYGNGLKLMEHSYVGNAFVYEVISLLMTSWKGHRVVWSGDYSDNAEHEWNESIFSKITPRTFDFKKEERVGFDSFELSCLGVKTLNDFVLKTSQSYVFVNYDEKIYCTLDCCSSKDGWQISPVPLLLANSNGRGGGDYTLENECVGSWAYDRVGVIHKNELPSDFIKITYNFELDW